jgi:hypothetical protein
MNVFILDRPMHCYGFKNISKVTPLQMSRENRSKFREIPACSAFAAGLVASFGLY